MSEDGQTLAYAELHEPGLILLLATKNLAEIRRSNELPFTSLDHHRMFAGFDHDKLCLASSSYGSNNPNANGLHFIRLGTPDLKPVSDTRAIGVSPEASQAIIWLPRAQRTWVNPPSKLGSDTWRQYTEAGQSTGQELEHRNGISYGAIASGEARLLAFYGNMVAKGAVVDYNDHHSAELNLECVPRPYGVSNDPVYAGALCATQKDLLPEAGGDKIVTSEFLLLKTDGPTVIWRHEMSWLAVANGNGPDDGLQKGDPLIYRAASKLWIVAPSKSPTLTVYEIDATIDPATGDLHFSIPVAKPVKAGQ